MEYFVIGADGKKYGPYDEKKLTELALAGRINASSTLIDAESGAGILAVNAIDFAEIHIPPSVNEGYNNSTYMSKKPISKKTNNLIVLSFIFLIFLQIIGVITSAFAIKNAKREGSDTSLATVALVLNIFVLVIIVPIIGVIFYPVFDIAREKSRHTTCLSNMKQTTTAMAMYSSDYNDILPDSKNWQEVLKPYVKNDNTLNCPEKKNKSSYAMNDTYSKVNINDIKNPADQILIFEAPLGTTHGTLENVNINKHRISVGYCDLHAARINPYTIVPKKNK